jgi:hypothetical protein
MANKADVDDAFWKGRQEGCEWAAREILRHLTAVDAPDNLRAIVVEVAQPDYFGIHDEDRTESDEIERVKADQQRASENHDMAIKAVDDAARQLRDAAILASYLVAAEEDSKVGELMRPFITDPATAADNYGRMADHLFDETQRAIQELLWSYRGRRLNEWRSDE